MRFLVLFLSFITLSNSAFALSCMLPDFQKVIESADLIAKAKVVKVKKPFIQSMLKQNYDEKVSFEIIQIYKTKNPDMPKTLTANISNFMRAWGPALQEGQEGEYLFRKDDAGWHYAGPGGCNYLDESSWESLRKNTQ